MRAGVFDRRIQLQLGTETLDAAGDPVITYADAFRRWASLKQRGSMQGEGAGAVLREFSVTFTVRDDRQSRSISPELYRIVYDGRPYVINGITEGEEGRHEVLVISCSTRPDQRGTVGQGASSVPSHD